MSLQVKDIIKRFSMIADVTIFQGDVYRNFNPTNPDHWEEIFTGSIMNIPWYIMDFYFVNTADGEAIDVYINEKGNPAFSFSVVEEWESIDRIQNWENYQNADKE